MVLLVTPKYNDTTAITLDMPAGDYRLEYKNYFGQRKTKSLRIEKGLVSEVNLCQDSLVSYPENTVSKLKNDERIIVLVKSYGCMAEPELKKVVISRQSDSLFATLYVQVTVKSKIKHRYYYKDSLVLSGSKMLTATDIAEFNRFENELPYSRNHNCTGKDFYTFISPYRRIIAEDASCAWLGFYHLKSALFGKDN
jgi:hypothetical protein